MKLRLCSAALACVAAVAIFAPRSSADPVWTDVSSTVSSTQTGLVIFGDLWITPETFTNNGSQDLTDVQYVNTEAWICLAVCDGTGPSGTYEMTWNNTLQEWQLLGANNTVEATVSPYDADMSLSLDPSSTNIPIPSGFGLSTADSVPAFTVGDLAAGASTSAGIDFLVSSDVPGEGVSFFYFNGSEVAETPTVSSPEPATWSLLMLGLLPLGLFGRKRLGSA